MGTFYEYKCKSCGYTINANPKGKDIVMMGEIHNYLCQNCNERVDVLYPYGEKPEKVLWPKCDSERLQKWNPKTGKCPKCGGSMEKTDLVLMVD